LADDFRVNHFELWREVVSRAFASWNQIVVWFRQIDALRQAA
jgi:hypothetical protein